MEPHEPINVVIERFQSGWFVEVSTMRGYSASAMEWCFTKRGARRFARRTARKWRRVPKPSHRVERYTL